MDYQLILDQFKNKFETNISTVERITLLKQLFLRLKSEGFSKSNINPEFGKAVRELATNPFLDELRSIELNNYLSLYCMMFIEMLDEKPSQKPIVAEKHTTIDEKPSQKPVEDKKTSEGEEEEEEEEEDWTKMPENETIDGDSEKFKTKNENDEEFMKLLGIEGDLEWPNKNKTS